ncbi:nuclear transport factor 2 family protein [Gammaproteobacteria bacterium]|nr:nuclear transport factor 2 family protein [Gammaproteobacteria bacterium]MDB9700788.1 nuclear transport factor 2 family protein [Gammaproteobacteria bacterium]MDC1300513.1 nuclear transport factor 2 family protein [Gammaproteobacteria bacterium]MDC1326472.1 nuclear transport factor 2 family protein [Gammaproteobacteria bacterium]MDC1525267.1 nuclear transport factor 2 family protein [Gammaproteobacteria bacterium]|tara:strand:- start:1001 stop:1399 length:399 start_codon:yes stop_codon:yes gene_type:complete
MDQTKQFLEQWYQGYRSDDPEFLDSILDESVVFTSPIVFNPIEGKAMTKMYLMGAGITFNMDKFSYVREVVDGLDVILEFETFIDNIAVNGVDMIRWNEEGRIIDFKVMVRPLQAIHKLQEKMTEALDSLQS